MSTADTEDRRGGHTEGAQTAAGGAAAVAALVTACGRRIAVAPLCIGGSAGPFARIALDVGPERDGFSRAWAGLSPLEARRLAALLLDQAAYAEQLAGSRA
ncbi:hypothetical protein [Streptacidiphilus griseoplanus]|uniref:hypothetical protein n=1 Tax=Peterkaempfera griseoplana TaxID=66896 RepID=UPI000A41D605|nr:hypothetical protein [Peterkaempfera griseoplana]